MTAQLYSERVGTGSKTLLLTHGIYGAGANWRAIARKLVTRREDWSVLLVDLRGHGRSAPGAPPHTVTAAADDLRAVAIAHDVTALAGHSFGGKVVLAARSLVSVEQTWMLDSSPSPRPHAFDEERNSVTHVLALLERAQKPYAKREDFIAEVTASGHAPALAQWLAMNLVPDGDQFVLRLDPAQLRALLESYYTTDLWGDLLDPSGGDVRVVIAERSDTIDEPTRTRLAEAPSHVHVHRVAADHWLHIEVPETVVELLASHLR